MSNRSVWLLCVLLVAARAFAARSLVLNGGFEKGKQANGQWLVDGWHIRLTDYMPKTIRAEDGTKSFRYVCACGKDLGSYKPWCGLRCPNCGGFIGGEEAGSWYVNNHELVSLVPGARGRAIHFRLPVHVGNNQGVRVYSRLIHARPGWGYKLAFDAKTSGSIARVFVECYRYPDTESDYIIDTQLDPSGTKRPLARCFRAHVNCGSPTSWRHFTKQFAAPKRYRFDWMTVKLYAYMPGEAWFDNVVLAPMSPGELDAYIGKRKPKDKRFEY